MVDPSVFQPTGHNIPVLLLRWGCERLENEIRVNNVPGTAAHNGPGDRFLRTVPKFGSGWQVNRNPTDESGVRQIRLSNLV